MRGQFDTFFAFIGAGVSGDGLFFEINGEGVVVRLDDDLFADGPGGHGIGVCIEADGKVGVDLCGSRVPAIGEKLGQGSEGLDLEALDGSLAGCAVDSHIGHGVSPVVGLGSEGRTDP